MRHHSPNRKSATRYINHRLAEMEIDGLLDWHGEYRNGQKVYVTTDAGFYALGQLETRRTEADEVGRRLSNDFVRRFLQDAVRRYNDLHGNR